MEELECPMKDIQINMARHSYGCNYPDNWFLVAYLVKQSAGWCCILCGHPHDPKTGHTLTVHHLDMNPGNCAWWNLAALCQKCHLSVQARIFVDQPNMFGHEDWYKPFVAGYHAHIFGLPEDKKYVMDHLDELINYGFGSLIYIGEGEK